MEKIIASIIIGVLSILLLIVIALVWSCEDDWNDDDDENDNLFN